MEFTGERYVPGTRGLEEIYVEHMSRYVFASGLAGGLRVVDIGCGCGYGAHYLALSGAAGVLGVDNSEEAVRFARDNYRHPNLSFAVMNALALGMCEGADLATCFEMIEHVEDARGLLREVRRVLGRDGILVVSTPNKATYAAGGIDGKNPFHFREYDLSEFGEILASEFAYVRMFGQFWTEGMALSSHPELLVGQAVRHLKLPDERGTVGAQVPLGEPPYFVAICAGRDVSASIYPRLVPAVTHCLATRYDRLKGDMRKLQDEFDRRGRWAQRLDEEHVRKDETIAHLQDELGSLREEFDERGRWAKSLDERVDVLEERLRTVIGENERLKRALAATGGDLSGRESAWLGKP